MYPIIVLWTHPRSLSTAIERVMRERGDLTCFHEPFMYDYYVHRQVRVMPHFDVMPDHPHAKRWVQYGVDELHGNVMRDSYPGGAWAESLCPP